MDLKVLRYGWYGGPGHSGERRVNDDPNGELYRDPDTNQTIPYYYDPIDALDWCFYRHDQNYNVAKATNDPVKTLLADIQLIYEVYALNPLSPDYPQSAYAQAYIQGVKTAFEGKLILDMAVITAWSQVEIASYAARLIARASVNAAASLYSFVSSINPALTAFTTAQSTAPPPPRFDPLILDLDGDGIETVASYDGAYFDHDGNGFAEQTGWVSSDDGLLVRDINDDGIINDGRELFADQTILQNGQTATDGFQALADLDGNADGKIDANDAAFSQLRIWQDMDGDGYSTADEMKTLDQLGISALNTGYTDTNIPDGQGNTQVQAGTFDKTDSTTGQMGGFLLQRDTAYTIAEEWLDVPADIAALPDLQGYGNVYNLHQAMVRNANLTVSARDSGGRLIGVARSLTDFAYCCYLSDLAVDAAWQRRGIGRELIRRTREAAGAGATLLLLSAPNAMDYYRRIGMDKIENGFAFARER